jgi:alanyl-tRNA synthetase
VAILRDGMEFEELTGRRAEAEVVLDRTPFYAEGGGQVGDQGVLRSSAAGASCSRSRTRSARWAGSSSTAARSTARTAEGRGVARSTPSAARRAHTMRNHTGTHLLHRALRNVVGERARQAGSLVTPDYLRFDFPFDRALTDDEKRAIEDEVRAIVREDRPVSIAFMTMSEAIEQGADAFFDEKYGETVRTIRVEDYSFELCGGTHCRASGQIGGSSSPASGASARGCAGSRPSPARPPMLSSASGSIGSTQAVFPTADLLEAGRKDLEERLRSLLHENKEG